MEQDLDDLDTAGRGQNEFMFVTNQRQQGVRSHAMKEYWKQRHRHLNQRRRSSASHTSCIRTLRPNIGHRPTKSLSDLATGMQTDDALTAQSSSCSATNSPSPSSSGSGRTSTTAVEIVRDTSSTSVLGPDRDIIPGMRDMVSAEPDGMPGGFEYDGGLLESIPVQVLTGVSRAMFSSRLAPFDVFPVQLTAQHHRLLHHCGYLHSDNFKIGVKMDGANGRGLGLSIHAAMVFEQSEEDAFNPMRDVWLPLDLSNAASFNTLMAHSAAHLASMHGVERSQESLMFKARALQIVRKWMDDPKLALGDDTMAAVLRLLNYERDWGSDAEWRLHRDGFQSMLRLRGGVGTLREQGSGPNRELQLATFLYVWCEHASGSPIPSGSQKRGLHSTAHLSRYWLLTLSPPLLNRCSLMTATSWLDSANRIADIVKVHAEAAAAAFASSGAADPGAQTMTGDVQTLHKIRCLWLLSLIQDLCSRRRHGRPGGGSGGLGGHLNAVAAVVFLQRDQESDERDPLMAEQSCNQHELTRLSCIILIGLLVHDASSGACSPPRDDAARCASFNLARFDYLLQLAAAQGTLASSVEGIHSLALSSVLNTHDPPAGFQKVQYATHVAEVLASMRPESRHCAERCLYHFLGLPQRREGSDTPLDGDTVAADVPPDAFLSDVFKF